MTFGQAEVVDVRTVGTWLPDEVLRLAASLDQASGHVTAAALVADARRKGLPLSAPTDVSEVAGTGIKGIVERRRLVIGGSRFVRDAITQGDPHGLREGLPWGSAVVAVGVDGVLAGIIAMADAIRPEAPAMLRALEKAGIDRVVIASGDRQDVVDAVAARLGIAKADGELDPAQKVEVVTRERMRAPVLMAGDGVNDAPALASADVGVALGARGSAASSESAGVVILVDRIDSLASAVEVAHRTRQIATQSVVAGLGLSVVGMAVAALGYLPPVAGALVQEGIDVAVILNALRALR
ncbi:HAD-IC family P-type ATPase [Mesorhizobium sp.]|uniref:HAD-IC family P-type ATPase n=1 Tax=Mesorhizobium sp. TaxID=1871066 RepID=UPI0033904BEE